MGRSAPSLANASAGPCSSSRRSTSLQHALARGSEATFCRSARASPQSRARAQRTRCKPTQRLTATETSGPHMPTIAEEADAEPTPRPPTHPGGAAVHAAGWSRTIPRRAANYAQARPGVEDLHRPTRGVLPPILAGVVRLGPVGAASGESGLLGASEEAVPKAQERRVPNSATNARPSGGGALPFRRLLRAQGIRTRIDARNPAERDPPVIRPPRRRYLGGALTWHPSWLCQRYPENHALE